LLSAQAASGPLRANPSYSFFVCFKFIRCESCGCWLRLVSFVKFNNILQPSLLPSEHCLTILLLLSQHQHPSILPSEVLVASPCCCCYDRHPVGSSDRTPAQAGKFRGQALRAHRSHYPFLLWCQAATSPIWVWFTHRPSAPNTTNSQEAPPHVTKLIINHLKAGKWDLPCAT
jgi:hypothetical protein